MKFTFGIEKKNKSNLGQSEGHNKRHHATKSQLPKSAWFDSVGHHSIVEWDDLKIEKARGLANRKDAILALEFVFQVGDQSDWREFPTDEYPCGKPKPGMKDKLKALTRGAKEAAEKEFGKENVVSIDLHLDESSPHVHVIVTPITEENKLQSRKWINGKAACAALRRRVHVTMSRHIESSYTPGGAGGEPFDPSKRAGGANGPQPEQGFLKAATAALSSLKIIADLKKRIEAYEKKFSELFNRAKRARHQFLNEVSERKKDRVAGAKALADKSKEMTLKLDELRRSKEDLERSSQLQITKLKSANDSLTSDNNELATTNNELKSAAQKRELRS